MDFKKNPSTDFEAVKKLSRREAEEEIAALREGIDYHDYRYYVKNDPVIADAVYDQLFRRLQELEEAFPELQTEDSPSHRVGAPPAEELKRVEHRAEMLSLNAALEKDKVAEWVDFLHRNSTRNAFRYVVEPKFDGVSVELIYQKGRFQAGATRGDGRTGEDVTANLRTVRSLPLRLRGAEFPASIAVRGEVFLPKAAFQQVNGRRVEQGKEPFANPRNACAGAIRRLESKVVAELPLDIFVYEILACEECDFSTHWQELEAFAAWGLKTDEFNRCFASFEEIAAFREELADKREELAYEIDGIVIKLDELALRETLGTRHRSPRWAMAWKFPPKKEVTTLEKIVVQVGTSGMLTPVALLAPVDVGGVTVSRATLHNEQEVKDKDLRAGDQVRVERAGDVIPEVVERVERPKQNARKFAMPEKCPACGTEVVREGAYVRCPAGLSCPAQLRGRVRHYGCREALDIDHLGEKTVEQLVDRGLVTTLADLYRLEQAELEALEGYAEKSARQLYEAIQGSKQPRLDRFLYALAIRHVGQRLARTLAETYGDLQSLRQAKEDELSQVGDIGPQIAASVAAFFHDNTAALDALQQVGVEVQPMPAEAGQGPLEGKTFVFTGALEQYTRDEAQAQVEKLGGRATSGVSGNSDFLVVGDDPGSKLDEAKDQGVKILDEKAFEKLLDKARGG